jgi:hypothetical protein
MAKVMHRGGGGGCEGGVARLRLDDVVDEHDLSWQRQLQWQSRVISRRQAREAGFTQSAIEWRIRSGEWRRLHRGAFATFTGDPSREARLWAALLRAGSGAVLSHETAAEVHGLIDKPSQQIHITVPAERHPGRSRKVRGVILHRSRWLVPRTAAGPPPRSPRCCAAAAGRAAPARAGPAARLPRRADSSR